MPLQDFPFLPPATAARSGSLGPAETGTAMEFSELIKTATVENVLLSCAGLPAVKGTLCITSHHLLLSSCPGGDGQPGTVELWLLIRNVDAVEKR